MPVKSHYCTNKTLPDNQALCFTDNKMNVSWSIGSCFRLSQSDSKSVMGKPVRSANGHAQHSVWRPDLTYHIHQKCLRVTNLEIGVALGDKCLCENTRGQDRKSKISWRRGSGYSLGGNGLDNRSSIPGRYKTAHFLPSVRTVLGPTQSPVQCILTGDSFFRG